MVMTANEMSIDRAIARGEATDGAPVKRADQIVAGDVVVVDWPSTVCVRVVHVHHEDAAGSGVHYCRWQVAPAFGHWPAVPDFNELCDVAFIGRLAHEYVRVVHAPVEDEA